MQESPSRRPALLPALALLLLLSPALPAAPACRATEADQLGPYYERGAPFTAELAGPREQGARLRVSGRVLGLPDCKPLADTVVDVWQASASGQYYSLSPGEDNRFKLRARLKTDEQGRYRFETVLPGHYGLGFGRSRPRHIHCLVTHPGYEPLVTQLYFQGDQELRGAAADPRAIALQGSPDQGYQGRFEIVMRPQGR